MKIVRRVLLIFVIAFVLFYVFARPQDAANAVHVGVDAVVGAGSAVVNFFTALTA